MPAEPATKPAIPWKRYSIGDLCDSGTAELQTGPFGSQLHAHDYTENGIPVVPTEAVRNRQIDHSVLPRISPAKAAELARHRLIPGDILFARRGVQATGHIGYVRDAEDGFLCGTGAIRLRLTSGSSIVTSEFLSHVFANPASVEWFKFHAIGATMPNLNEGIIRSFRLAIPPIEQQRAIAHILGALDDKIELNRRMNGTLEAVARAIFKSWFVDFDPVCAKTEGRQPAGMDCKLAELFPSAFAGSELGAIPVGWRVDTLGDMVDLAYGRALKSEHRRPGNIAVFGSNGQIGWHDELLVRGPGVVVGRKGNPGIVSWAPVDFFPIDTAFYVVPKGESKSLLFLYHSLCTHDLASLGADSAVPGLNRNMVYMSRQVMPTPDLLKAFDDSVGHLSHRVHANDQETRALTALRDALLPKLLSGEIRVRDAEKLAERAML